MLSERAIGQRSGWLSCGALAIGAVGSSMRRSLACLDHSQPLVFLTVASRSQSTVPVTSEPPSSWGDPRSRSITWHDPMSGLGAMAQMSGIEYLRAIADGTGPRHAVLALGYAGWQAGQLEAEMQGNGWLNVPGDAALIFDGALDSKYERAVRHIGIDLSRLSPESGRA